MIRASGLTDSTFYTVRSLCLQCTVTASGPFSQIISIQITGKQKHIGNTDTCRAGCTVITSAAEICTQLFSDLSDFIKLCLRAVTFSFTTSNTFM